MLVKSIDLGTCPNCKRDQGYIPYSTLKLKLDGTSSYQCHNCGKEFILNWFMEEIKHEKGYMGQSFDSTIQFELKKD